MDEGKQPAPSAETLYRVAGTIGLLVGVGALISPGLLTRLYGVKEEQNDIGAFGWRLFAIRNIYTSSRALLGDQGARDAVMLMQPPDMAVFILSYRAGRLPGLTTVLALISAAAVLAASAFARRSS
ncbi:MAG TPA: hypothetical protein VKA36_08810 [Solirubrobacterales bacterium]|nr:hypothetical protein [Solirubrobacterales bacterium]